MVYDYFLFESQGMLKKLYQELDYTLAYRAARSLIKRLYKRRRIDCIARTTLTRLNLLYFGRRNRRE